MKSGAVAKQSHALPLFNSFVKGYSIVSCDDKIPERNLQHRGGNTPEGATPPRGRHCEGRSTEGGGRGAGRWSGVMVRGDRDGVEGWSGVMEWGDGVGRWSGVMEWGDGVG